MNTRRIILICLGIVFLPLSGCGGGGGGSGDPPTSPTLSLDYGIKQLIFNWSVVAGATHYQLFEDPDGISGYNQVDGNLTATSYNHDIFLPARINARYLLNACNSSGCTQSSTAFVSASLVDAIGYVKASNTEAGDHFGTTLALSSDGTTLAVGASGEDSDTTGVDGNQADNSASGAGAVYVFTRSGSAWIQQAYIKASNAETNDSFGRPLALSGDGNTLVIGAYREASGATGVDGNQADNSTAFAGAVYVFIRSGSAWTQQAYLKASNTETDDRFGGSLALSSDGNTLAVGAAYEDSVATGVNGNQSDNSASRAGAVYVFTRSGDAWSQQAYVKASNTEAEDYFGFSVAISSDGNTLAVGAIGEASSATGVGGNQAENTAAFAGAVYVFVRSGSIWSQQAYIKASNAETDDEFGGTLALGSDGNTLAVGADNEDSSATGVGGDQNDNSAGDSGAVYVLTRSGSAWTHQAYIKASNTGATDRLGNSLALSHDGNTLAVGTSSEDSAAIGLGGDQNDNSATLSGAVYFFSRIGNTWSQQAYVKASNTETTDGFGAALSLSGDGNTLAAGAPVEDSAATGVGGDQSDNSAAQAGAVYLY